MSIEVKVPQLPESVADATLVTWHKKPGEFVARDENLVDLETDKVVLEVPAPMSGVLEKILIQDGATVTSGQLIAILAEGAVAATAPAPSDSNSEKAEAATRAVSTPVPAPAASPESSGKLSPSVRRLVDEHKLAPASIRASGPDGRLTKGDVLAHLELSGDDHDDDDVDDLPAGLSTARTEKRVPMTRLRVRIAERLVEAQQSAAMLTTFNEVDLSEIMALRGRYKDAFEKRHGVRLGFMSFFVTACAEALRKFPVVNAYVENNEIVYHNYYDIGVAVSTERGLVVPVLRNADQLGFAEIEKSIGDMALRARDGKLTIEELTGGTFSLTNGGVFGSLMSTPILNPPQSAILGMHKIQERPMVVGGEVKIRPMMYLAMTYDHRIIDGRESVQFLVSVKEALEDPSRLLLEL
ncbi:MAG: 2-oxoglutarate dehydrogenase complex dihydrolipoyllysine-residue succinyltransferase [Gammaproteobacteria bacterium]|nr:2-oxoglutarate dehydrogenase complex dihydrolipoyllysine-residue succinyltransferase [Gammaproteobacteria bacterium]